MRATPCCVFCRKGLDILKDNKLTLGFYLRETYEVQMVQITHFQITRASKQTPFEGLINKLPSCYAD